MLHRLLGANRYRSPSSLRIRPSLTSHERGARKAPHQPRFLPIEPATSYQPQPAYHPGYGQPRQEWGLTGGPSPAVQATPEAAQEAPRCSCRADTLLWPRQLNELTVLRRVLNRRRPKGAGERITENTLVRLAIDLLLANAGQLQGSTEDELRRSLGLGD